MDKEILDKIRKDPKLYLETFTKIKGKTPGLIPFILNEAQKDFFNTLNKEDRIIILKARQIGFCLSEDTKILLSTLKWIPIKDVNIGDKVIAIDENVPGNRGQRKMRTAIVENKTSFKEHTIKITFDDGRFLIGTLEHRVLSKKWECSTETSWKKFKDIKIGDSVRYITKPWEEGGYESGWFGGVLDGEGSISKPNRSGVSLTVSQVEGVVLDRLMKYVVDNKITYRVEIDKRLPGETSKFGLKPVYKIVINKMNELFNIFGSTRPSRLFRNWWEGKALPNDGWIKVVSIEDYGFCNVVDLQTSEHTYIAEGIVSHNSTAATGWIYHNTVMTPGTNSAIIGYNSDLTSELLDKVKTFWRTTPADLRPKIKYNSKFEISFPNIDSKIIVLPSTENVGRGYTLHNVLATELSSWEKAEEKMMTLEASVPVGGKIIVESTPRGVGNLYHKMWVSNDNGYIKKEYGWWWLYSEEEIEMIKKRMNNPMKFAQEYSLEFLASGRPIFDQSTVQAQRKNILEIGDTVMDVDGKNSFVRVEDELRMYVNPKTDGLYVCGVDVAEGVEGGDFSVATIWDRKTGEEVAFYRGLCAPDRFGQMLNSWGRKYNNALMVVEINNHGLTTVTILKQLMYPSLYFRPKQFDQMGMIYTDRIGWKTTKLTRPLMIDDLAQAMRDNVLTIHSKETLDEMTTFIYDKSNNMVCIDGFHDDCIFSSCLAYQGFKVMFSEALTQINYENHLPSGSNY